MDMSKWLNWSIPFLCLTFLRRFKHEIIDVSRIEHWIFDAWTSQVTVLIKWEADDKTSSKKIIVIAHRIVSHFHALNTFSYWISFWNKNNKMNVIVEHFKLLYQQQKWNHNMQMTLQTNRIAEFRLICKVETFQRFVLLKLHNCNHFAKHPKQWKTKTTYLDSELYMQISRSFRGNDQNIMRRWTGSGIRSYCSSIRWNGSVSATIRAVISSNESGWYTIPFDCPFLCCCWWCCCRWWWCCAIYGHRWFEPAPWPLLQFGNSPWQQDMFLQKGKKQYQQQYNELFSVFTRWMLNIVSRGLYLSLALSLFLSLKFFDEIAADGQALWLSWHSHSITCLKIFCYSSLFFSVFI